MHRKRGGSGTAIVAFLSIKACLLLVLLAGEIGQIVIIQKKAKLVEAGEICVTYRRDPFPLDIFRNPIKNHWKAVNKGYGPYCDASPQYGEAEGML